MLYIRASKTNHIWITADLHIGHSNIIKYCNRPYKDAEEMNVDIVNNINKYVKEDDILIINGDFCIGRRYLYFINLINCKNVYLVIGNHDRRVGGAKYLTRFFPHVDKELILIYNQYKFLTHHYVDYDYQGWQLVGHSHYTNPKTQLSSKNNSFDVGVDGSFIINKEFRPYNLSEIIELFNRKNNANR